MGLDLVLYQLALVIVVWLFIMLHVVWPNGCGAGGHTPATLIPPLWAPGYLSPNVLCKDKYIEKLREETMELQKRNNELFLSSEEFFGRVAELHERICKLLERRPHQSC